MTSSMTYERFSQLWAAAGLSDRAPVHNPIIVDEMSPRTIDALVAVANGDETAFDRAAQIRATT